MDPRPAPRPAPRPRVVSPTSLLSALAQRLSYMERFPARRFVNLIENVPQWPSVEGAPGSSWRQVHSYAPARGQDELLARVAACESGKHAARVTEENLLVTNGALHGLSIILRRYGRRGAVALCQAPVLGAVPQMMRSYGYRPVFFSTPGGQVDGADLERLAPGEVGLLYVNSPHNPVGDVLSREAMGELVALARRRGAALVADMVYDSFAFDGARVTSPLELEPDWRGVYVVNSMSKGYGSPGLRVGWIVSAAEDVAALASVLERENISVCGPAQDIACGLLSRGNGALVDATAAGRRRLADRLAQIRGVGFALPTGGTQLLARLAVPDVEEFCDFALVELGLGLVSSSNYEGVAEPFVRLPLGAPPAALDDALGLLGQALAAYLADLG